MEVGVTPDYQRRGSESSSAAPASSRRPGTISETLYPLELGNVAGQKVLQRQLTKGERCMCSHGCGQPKHSRSNCISKEVVVGSKFCQNCECIWKGCNHIRLWGEFCKNHKRTLAEVGETWQIVRAAGSLNSQLVPCDVDSFNSFYQLYPTWFLECVSVAFLKEPEPVKQTIDAVSGIGARTGVDRREYVRLAWRKVVMPGPPGVAAVVEARSGSFLVLGPIGDSSGHHRTCEIASQPRRGRRSIPVGHDWSYVSILQ